MRRIVVVATAVVALLGAFSPPVWAQAPAPKVTINGLIDTVTIAGTNVIDGNFARRDETWHARNRGVFTVTGEVGKAKGVLALEIDLGWGQVGSNESVVSNSGQTISSSTSAFGSQQQAFQQGAFDLGNDVGGVIEIKNMYVEFPVPWIPFATVLRLGGQPFQTTLKPSTVATTDYGGVWLSSTINPWLKFNFTFAQLEERSVGIRITNNFFRGDDWFIMPSIDIEPMKGVKIRPFWGYYEISGNSQALSRCRVECAGLPNNGTMASVNQFTGAVTATTGLGNYLNGGIERRNYWGLDAQTNFGPFYFDPTVIYESSNVPLSYVASRPTIVAGLLQGGIENRTVQHIRSWLVDVRGGWRSGPLLLEGMVVYTPGDDAQHDSFHSSKVYHAVSTDNAAYAGWQDILGNGSVDYFTGTAHGMSESHGFGRYGLIRVGGRASYALTPAFTLIGRWVSAWTDTKVDTDAPVGTTPTPQTSFATGSYGATPCAGPGKQTPANGGVCLPGQNNRGEERYIGTEFNLGFSYNFAPGLTLDLSGAYLFAGHAWDTTSVNDQGVLTKNDATNSKMVAARVRYQF